MYSEYTHLFYFEINQRVSGQFMTFNAKMVIQKLLVQFYWFVDFFMVVYKIYSSFALWFHLQSRGDIWKSVTNKYDTDTDTLNYDYDMNCMMNTESRFIPTQTLFL